MSGKTGFFLKSPKQVRLSLHFPSVLKAHPLLSSSASAAFPTAPGVGKLQSQTCPTPAGLCECLTQLGAAMAGVAVSSGGCFSSPHLLLRDWENPPPHTHAHPTTTATATVAKPRPQATWLEQAGVSLKLALPLRLGECSRGRQRRRGRRKVRIGLWA